MKHLEELNNKIYRLDDLVTNVVKWKNQGRKIVFTNGCFDIVHKGHIELLAKTADLGDKLIVAINSDASIKNLKGEDRPIIDQDARSMLLAGFSVVDAVVIFEEETPLNLIQKLLPNILSKGGDYNQEEIVGYKEIKESGGKVITVPLTYGFSTTSIVNQIKK